MCVVSMVTDHKIREWEKRYPWTTPVPVFPRQPGVIPGDAEPITIPVSPPPVVETVTVAIEPTNDRPTVPPTVEFPTQEEIAEFYRLLERARQYDEENNEPHCEETEKRAKLRKMAEAMGIDIKFPGE